MALNFPDSPTLNQVYTDTTSGFSYQWDGVVWQSYSPAASKNISIVDNIESSFNGVTQTFSLAVSGTALTPANAQQLRVVLGGIVQEPLTDYTVSGSNITFTTPPTGGLDCSIVSLGPAFSVSVPGDGTVTPVKLSTGGPYWNTDGDVVITGIGTTALLVNGNARVTGILTVGTSSITLDGTNNTINVGSLSISQGGISGGTPNINVGFITATGASISGSVTVGGNVSIAGTLTYEDVTNVDSIGIVTARAGVNVTGGSVVVGSAVTLSSGGINVAGVVTSTSFVGNVTGNSTGLSGTPNLNVGVVTATSFFGNGSGLSGVGDFSSGTALLFQQTAAPTGWTKQTTHNDKSLRVVSGAASSGGTTAFTSVFTSRSVSGTVGNTTLTTSQMPSHSHVINLATTTGGLSNVSWGANLTAATANTATAGNGDAHNHSFSGSALDFNVQYVDVIIATKN